MNNTTLQPPPERDFPPGRHGSMREEILRDVRRRRTRGPRALGLRRHLLPLVAATAVIVVVALAVAIPKLVGGPDPKPVPALSPKPSPTAAATIPGFSDAQLTTLRDSCVTGAKNEKREPGSLGRKQTKDVVDLDTLRLYNATTDKEGTVALLGNGTQIVVCAWMAMGNKSSLPPAARLQSVGHYEYAAWLPGPVSVDFSGGSDRGTKSNLQIVGRVPRGVTDVQIVLNEGTDKQAEAKAKVVDGTYAVSMEFEVYNNGWPIPTVRTFDANGTKVGERGGRNNDCFVSPDGAVVSGGVLSDPATCKEATPWR